MTQAKDSILVGIFDDATSAQEALEEMRQSGIDPQDTRMMIRGSEVNRGGEITDALGTKDAPGAWNGVLIGALGGALVGIVGGFFVRAGTDATLGVIGVLAGMAGAGAAIGGILGAMIGLRLSEREANYYQKKFPSGRAVLTLSDTSHSQSAGEIMRKHGGHDLRTLSASSFPNEARLLADVFFRRR